MSSYAVLDLETMSDWWDDDDMRIRNVFPPLHTHRICCASLLIISSDEKRMHTRYAKDESEEAELLRALGPSLRSLGRCVTWNGRGFDFPVLSLRVMALAIEGWEWFDSRRYRFHGWHLDLMDWLREYGAARMMSLDNVSTELGLGGKTSTGAMEGLSREEIIERCEHDVELTAAILDRAVRYLGLDLRWRAGR